MLQDFFREIKDLNWVVQRNWQNLPGSYEVIGHSDLDLFSTDEDKQKIVEILKKYPTIPCDVRSLEDDYYPREIADRMLNNRIEMDGFYIPEPEVAFFALYYHNLVHKSGNDYRFVLEDMFKKMFSPVKCKDGGVGYFV